MRKRDLGILIISAFAIFFSLQNEGNFSFKESWFHVVDEAYPIKHEAERLPPPLVTDLNADGRNEVIVATHDSKLLVLDPHSKLNEDGFSEARTVTEVSLLPEKVRISAGRRPVAMAAGVIQRSYNEGKPRKQVLVVVTAGWVIMCFDHNLKKLWESSVQDDFPHGAFHKEVSISISNFTLRHGDTGLIIVGGSMEAQSQVYLDPFEEELLAEKEEERHRHAADAKEGSEDVNAGKTHHFSYYAFAGMTGERRWEHKSADFHRDLSSAAELTPQHNYRLDAASLQGRQLDEVHCRDYRQSILQVLPHRWQSRDDTRFQLVHFVKHERKHHKKQPGSNRERYPLKRPNDPHVPGKDPSNKVAQALGKAAKLATSARPKTRYAYIPVITNQSSYWWLPNVVVAHLKEGIEAVHLASGRTVCKLWLQEGGLHADINGDGVLDHVQAVGGSGTHVAPGTMEAIKPCWAVASSGTLVRQQLFNGSICRNSGYGAFQQGEFMSRTFGRNLDASPIEVVPPVFFLRPTGYGDVIFLTSRGEVTSYTPAGNQRWQIVTGAIWSSKPMLSSFGVDRAVPTLEVMALRKNGRGEVILAAGEQEAVLISSSGHQIATLALPSPPARPIVVADFSGDGFNDVIVVTASGIYGFVQTQHQGAVFFSFLVGCLIIAMCVIFVMQHLQAPKGKPKKKSTDL
ncbi:uncharacterized protein LOC9648148 [Selaginella moellendorffii]|uniref:uncharacterized protein LOC9648148 n=1 Tax=Selaginella moellendorffii TaxID=88036 RepID=UPI000D1C65FC|nr:uncharacterized protein LOC9648148 [Selaginella moellendorffii]|eukprot:XP_024542548.1 uncharacterized protein LOC9648148 [Selaginella moellendorffii]